MADWQLGPVVRGIRGHRAAAALVVVQLGLGLALTVLAVMIGDYFANRQTLRVGGAASDLAFVEVQSRTRGDAVALVGDVLATPGCAAATVVAGLPLHALERDTDDVRAIERDPIERHPDDAGRDARTVEAVDLDSGAGFLAASGLALAAGRDFVDADLGSAGPVRAIVSAALAQELWPGQSPLGARLWSRSHGEAVVVGVLAPVRSYLLGESAMSVVYARVDTAAPHTVVLARAAPGGEASLRSALNVRLTAPGRAVVVLDAVEHVRARYGSVRAVLGILGTLTGTIVLVIVIGSMGLTYFLVSRRTREIGVRRALGATRGDVVRFFVVENIVLTIAGVLLGIALVGAVLPAVVYEQPDFRVDVRLTAVAIAAVVALNLLATWIPARKAASVSPVVASRQT